MQLSGPCWDTSANLKSIFLASLYMYILNITTAQNVTQASNSSDIPTSLNQFNETRNGSDILTPLSSVTNKSNNSDILASLSPFTDVTNNSATTTSTYTVTQAVNETSVSTSPRPFKSLKKKGFYIRSNNSRGNTSSMDSFVLHFKALKKLKGNGKKVSSSPYQSQLVKAKQYLAGNQDAPDDATSGHLSSHPRGKPKKPIFCYFGSSANSRPSAGKFWPEHIDPFLCTHLVFAFVDITEDGTGLRPNNWNDLGEKGLYARTMKLKEKNPDLKVLLAAGGWKIGSKPFLPVIKSEETWKTWVANVVAYLRKYNFDGFDMDWEFPTWRGSGPEDKHKFTLLMKELYEKFAEEANYSGKDRLLLTLATASSAFYAEKSYEQSEIHKYIDYMLLMTYNFHGSGWEKQTGHHSPLLPHPLDPEGEQRELYILWAVKYWLNFGVPKEKIILGLSTYGLGWKLTDISQTGIKAPANGGSSKGKYTDESGILSLYEICESVINDDWKVHWIEEQKVPYAYGAGEWVGFDSPDSFYLKAAVIVKEGLGGAFVWSVEMDDFNGHCGGPKYPLLRTIYEVFTQSSSVSSWDSLKSIKSAPAAGHQHVQSSSAAAKDGPGESHTEAHHGEEGSAAEHPAAASPSDDSQFLAGSDKEAEYSNYYPYDEAEAVGADATQAETGPDKDTEYSYHYAYDEAEVVDPEIFNCNNHGLGIHADPTSCHHFILCMPASNHELGSSRMSCPSGTLFDEKVKVCNHEHSVNCQH